MVRHLKTFLAFLDDRLGIQAVLQATALHRIPPSSARWSYVWGSATLTCLVVQVLTGVALAMLYQPSTETAYESLQWISTAAPLGPWLRGLHYFGASGMVVMMVIHMIQVYITAAYKYPREMNWITGVILLGLTVSMAFTGQLLRWDDVGVWSTYVAAEQMGRIPVIGKLIAYLLIGGETVGGHTLSRFFAYHVFLLPGLLFTIVGVHLYLVLRHGISEPPVVGVCVDPDNDRKKYEDAVHKNGIPFFPDAAWRDIVFALLLVTTLSFLAFTVGAPALGGPPDPTKIDVVPGPDWYLVWIFALYALMPPGIEDYVIVGGPVVGVLVLLSIPFLAPRGERHVLRRPWALIGVVLSIGIVTALTIIGFQAPWSPNFKAEPVPMTVLVTPSEQAQAGVDLFNTKGCLYCHDISGHGGHRGPNLTDVDRRLVKDEIVVRIVNGGDFMPAYGGSLSKEEIESLAAFLLSPKNDLGN
jgi:ubiquinol-cytochrome c reductase cytochrome b subunit